MASAGTALEKVKENTNRITTAAANIITLISLAIPLSMIVLAQAIPKTVSNILNTYGIPVGAVYINSCPVQRYIPIYLIVAGVFSTMYCLIRMFSTLCLDEMEQRPKAVAIPMGIMGFFNFAWFIAGNVWIYGTNNAYSTKYGDPNYCNNTLYLYAFWLLTGSYILIAVMIVTFCCSFWIFCCYVSRLED